MRSLSRWTKVLSLVAAAAAVAAVPASARADRIWTKANPTAKPFERKDLKVLKVDATGNLVFKVITSDRQDTKPLAEIWQIEADGEAKLNAAEAAFAAGDFAKSVGEYEGAISGSKAAWVKLRAATRVVEAASNAKNFPAAIKGYASLLSQDPALANGFRPVPQKDATPASLAAGVTAAESAAEASAASDQKGALLTVALEFARAANDNAAATRIADKLGKVDAAPAPVTPGTANTPPAASNAQANRRIQLALVALGNKDFAGALKQINEAPEVFTDPAEQVEALYVLAEGKNGLAKDTEALKDAGIEYMRVVARAKASNLRSPRVADALYKTAVIHERIRQPEEAAILYQQVASEFDGTEFATKAGGALARLEKKDQ